MSPAPMGVFLFLFFLCFQYGMYHTFPAKTEANSLSEKPAFWSAQNIF